MRFLLATLALTLASCSSKQETKGDEYGGRFQERLGKQMKAMKSQDLESPFQKAFDSDSGVKTGTSYLQRKGFRSNDYTGFNRDFNGSHAARTKQFAQADRTSPTGNRQFNGATEDREAGQLFRSKSSPANGQTARQSSQVASGMDREFGTTDVRDAAKSQQKNIRPLIIEPKGKDGKEHDYSEDQVRAFMSRD
ncbi:MAG: hypothetical protein KDK97_14810 [Verrucomicrobiales bacterium]|nr:hypothetical protein [Verrucomicrobiales bacterium]MCP5558752.1 hypothetical protein [Verrucomicrobiaceae bacterium]